MKYAELSNYSLGQSSIAKQLLAFQLGEQEVKREILPVLVHLHFELNNCAGQSHGLIKTNQHINIYYIYISS